MSAWGLFDLKKTTATPPSALVASLATPEGGIHRWVVKHEQVLRSPRRSGHKQQCARAEAGRS
jgi:hypothetical protein